MNSGVPTTERQVAQALWREARERMAQGELAVAVRLAERARAAFWRAGEIEHACSAACLESRVRTRLGQTAAAREALLWAADQATRRGLRPLLLTVRTDLAALDEASGDLSGALAAHRDVLAQQQALGNRAGSAVAAANIGRLLTRVSPGLAGEARTLLGQALGQFLADGHVDAAANARICLGDLEQIGRAHV